MTRKFFISIPMLLEAKFLEQWTFIFTCIYDGEMNKLTAAFNRDSENRFYILDRLEIPGKNKKKLEHIKGLLGVLNKSHKKDTLTPEELIDLDREATLIDQTTFEDISITAKMAVSIYWDV